MRRNQVLFPIVVMWMLAGLVWGAERGPFIQVSDIDFSVLFSAPPEAGSEQQIAESATMLHWQNRRTAEDVMRCRAESNCDAFIFSEVLGDWFNARSLPITADLLDKTTHDLKGLIDAAKQKFDRPRPYVTDPRIHPCVELEKTFSYPSGQATCGIVWASVLSEIFPEYKERLFEVGQRIGDDQAIAGVHYPSDVAAGQKFGAEVAHWLLQNPRFSGGIGAGEARVRGGGSLARANGAGIFCNEIISDGELIHGYREPLQRQETMKRMVCGAAVLVLGICSLSKGGQVFSVAADANGAGVEEAIGKAQPGDTVRLAAGTYHLDKPLVLAAKGTESQPIRVECEAAERAELDFSGEPEQKGSVGINLSGDYWQLNGIEVARAGSYGINITGGHNTLQHCVTRENRSSGTQIEAGGSYTLVEDCDSYRNFDPKTLGEDADGFTAKHAVGPGNVFRGCRSYQNSDDGWDLWMCPYPILIEDCVSIRNGMNIWKIANFQGDGNGFKFGGNYVPTAHIARRCVSIENPLHGFDQNHNTGAITIEDCVAIRCGKGFSFPEVPNDGKVILRRDTSFGCQNVLEPEVVSEGNHWYPDIPSGTLGPPPRPGHRNVAGAGVVPTTEPTPMMVPEGAPRWGRPGDVPATQPYPDY